MSSNLDTSHGRHHLKITRTNDLDYLLDLHVLGSRKHALLKTLFGTHFIYNDTTTDEHKCYVIRGMILIRDYETLFEGEFNMYLLVELKNTPSKEDVLISYVVHNVINSGNVRCSINGIDFKFYNQWIKHYDMADTTLECFYIRYCHV